MAQEDYRKKDKLMPGNVKRDDYRRRNNYGVLTSAVTGSQLRDYATNQPSGGSGTGTGTGTAGGTNGGYNYTPIQPGPYQNAYSGTINDLINQAINRQPFEYDPATDQAYQAYARQYTRLGNQAAQDTLADVAANTGGLASSYATTAAEQARANYNQALTDKIPELMQLAYDRYRNEYQDTLSGIGTLQDVSNSLYGRYSDQRDFDESVRQYEEQLSLSKDAQKYEQMLNLWNALGYATSEIAKFFGVPEGTKTDDAAYRAAQLALSGSSSGGSGGSGGSRGRSSSYSGSGGSSQTQPSTPNTPNSNNNTDKDPGHTENAEAYWAYLQSLSYPKLMAAVENLANYNGLTNEEKEWIYKMLGALNY